MRCGNRGAQSDRTCHSHGRRDLEWTDRAHDASQVGRARRAGRRDRGRSPEIGRLGDRACRGRSSVSTDVVTAPSSQARRTGGIGTATYACAFVVAALSFVVFGLSAEAFVSALFAVVLVVLAAIDLERGLIPNTIVLPAAAVVLLAHIAIHPSRTVEWLVAAAAAFTGLLVVALINPAGLGVGDGKLALPLRAGLGGKVAPAPVLGAVASAVFPR